MSVIKANIFLPVSHNAGLGIEMQTKILVQINGSIFQLLELIEYVQPYPFTENATFTLSDRTENIQDSKYKPTRLP